MLVGVPKEIKDNEFRVGMTPAAVAELVHHGHEVIVETSAGVGSGSPDEEYLRKRASKPTRGGYRRKFAGGTLALALRVCLCYKRLSTRLAALKA